MTSNERISPVAAILLAGGLATAVSMGVRSTMGVYLDPITVDLGISTGAFGFAIAIQNLVWGLGQPIAGAVADRYGSARVLVAGGVLYIFGLAAAGAANTSAGISISLGVITGLGLAGLSFAVILASVGRLVDESRRATALATTTAFGSLGQFVLVPLTQSAIDVRLASKSCARNNPSSVGNEQRLAATFTQRTVRAIRRQGRQPGHSPNSVRLPQLCPSLNRIFCMRFSCHLYWVTPSQIPRGCRSDKQNSCVSSCDNRPFQHRWHDGHRLARKSFQEHSAISSSLWHPRPRF